MMRRLAARHDLGAQLLGLAILIVAWQLATTLADDPTSWPRFTDIAARLWTEWLTDPAAWSGAIGPSLGRLLVGWSLAVVIGLLVGAGIGRSPTAHDVVSPIVHFARAVPPPAFLPVALVLFGIGDGMRIAVIVVGCVWPVLLATADAIRRTDPLHLDAVHALRLPWKDRWTRVLLPGSAPAILTGMRISLSMAVILMVVSEMVAAVNGIGFELVQAQRSFRSLDVWAAILALGLLGWLLNALLLAMERRVLWWRSLDPVAAS